MKWWSSNGRPRTDVLSAYPTFHREWDILLETNSVELAFWYEMARRLDPQCCNHKPFPLLSPHAFDHLKGLWADAGRWDMPRKGYQAITPAIIVGERVQPPRAPFSPLITTTCNGKPLSPFYINLDKADKVIAAEAERNPELGLPPRSMSKFKTLIATCRRKWERGAQPNILTRRWPAWKQLEALDENIRCAAQRAGTSHRQKLSTAERQAVHEARKNYRRFVAEWRERQIENAIPSQWAGEHAKVVRAQIAEYTLVTSWEVGVRHRIFLQ